MRRAAGFTLKEMLIVVGAIGLIDCVLLMAISPGKPRPSGQVQGARMWMNSIKYGIEQHRVQVGTYPPDIDPNGKLNSAELLYKHLCVPIVAKGVTYGPFFAGGYSMDRNGNGAPDLSSYLGGAYEYRILRNPDGTPRGFLIVDPGQDQKLGGALDPLKGFVKTPGPVNPEIKSDDADNIYSTDPLNFDD